MFRGVIRSRTVSLAICALCIISKSAGAGPPFITDDPDPVEYKHWEVYIASLYNNDKFGLMTTSPHVEVNYGAAPNVQLHIIAPMTYSRSVFGPAQYGYGDMEFGVKWRFAQESAKRPMVGIFPLIEVPTGAAARGLGSGQTAIFLPLWIQKSWGSWTTYGGGGPWHNPGVGNRDYGFVGWLLQKNVTKKLAIGTELFYTSSQTVGGPSRTGFNVGFTYDFDEGHHLMGSVGDDVHGNNRGMGYLAYQWTFGPKVKQEEKPDVPLKQDAAPAR